MSLYATDNKNIVDFKMQKSSLTYFDLPINAMFSYKTYDKIRFIVVLSGRISYSFGNETIFQSKTNMILLPQYSHVELHAIKSSKLMVIEANDELIKSAYESIEFKKPFSDTVDNPKLFIPIKYTNVLYSNIQNIHSEYLKNSDDPYLVELSVCKLVYHLLKSKYSGYLFSMRARHPMEQVKYYIERNLKESIKINDLADLVGMTSSNFTNTFKRYFGKSPLNYINELKMKYAESLLKENSVTEVAYDMGFENVSTFISQFKKTYEVTPKQFQILNLYN